MVRSSSKTIGPGVTALYVLLLCDKIPTISPPKHAHTTLLMFPTCCGRRRAQQMDTHCCFPFTTNKEPTKGGSSKDYNKMDDGRNDRVDGNHSFSEDEVDVESLTSELGPENKHGYLHGSNINAGFIWNAQIHLTCENLIWSGNFDRLERFIWALPDIDQVHEKEVVQIAKAFVAYKHEKYNELYDILKSKHYSKKYHSLLQVLWRNAHYMDAEKERGRILCSVGKYRIRRKYPLPSTIWDGKSLSHCFSEDARKALNEVYRKTPYPTASEKLRLAESANLTVAQVQNWFKNKRQRSRDIGGKQKRDETRPSFFLENFERNPAAEYKESESPANIHEQFRSYMRRQEHQVNSNRPVYCIAPHPPPPKPIKPVFHKVKPIILPVIPSFSSHVYTRPRYVRCMDWLPCTWTQQYCTSVQRIRGTSPRHLCCKR